MAFLELNKITKNYGSVQILHEITISVEQGEFLVLVGPSGCGKSTLLSMIAGLESVSSGEIIIDGHNMDGVRPADRNIAMVFQSYALYPNMNVAQNMSFGLEMKGVPKARREKIVKEVAELLHITKLLDRKPAQLSGGQRQRVAMGRALVRNPAVFLFDEPLSNLDAKLRVDMRTEIKKLHHKLGTTIVYVTHDQIEALTLASRIAVMHAGYIQQIATPEEIYNKPINLFVAGFMGSPPMNLFPATIIIENNETNIMFRLADDRKAIIPLANGALDAYAGRQVIIGLRPELMTDQDSADPRSNAIWQLNAPVITTEPTGSDTFVVSQFGGEQVIGRIRADLTAKPGDIFPFTLNMEKALIFDPESEQLININP